MCESDNKVKVLAMYLPQYHEIEENSIFWGKGFTDWCSVKKAKPLFLGHNQPRVPLDEEYYDLSQKKSIEFQAKLAKENGVYGFGLYHYWFSDKKNLLTTPSEIILTNKDIDIPFFFAWDNISWKRTWSNIKGNDWAPIIDMTKQEYAHNNYLVEYVLGREEQWKIHYEYLLPFFKDERYIKVGNKPMFSIYHYSDQILEMAKYWDTLAKEDGFDGVEIIYRNDITVNIPKDKYSFHYEPSFSGWGGFIERATTKILKKFGIVRLRKYDYDRTWKKILKTAQKSRDEKLLHGGFVAYDDTPRRGKNGKVVINENPSKFQKYISKLIEITKAQKKEYIFLTAWNEWGEGAYLEPDTINEYAYLDALRIAISKNNEKGELK